MKKGEIIRPAYSAPAVLKLDASKNLFGGEVIPDCETGSSPNRHCYNGNTANVAGEESICRNGNVASRYNVAE